MIRDSHNSKTLRCSAFEELMLDQDSPHYPCVIVLRLQLKGHLETERLRDALASVADRHPLLRAKLQCRWCKLWWHIEPTNNIAFTIHETSAPAWPIERFFDLNQDVGFQADLFRTSTEEDAWTLFLQIHHAAADGLGCVQIVQDLLLLYSQSDQVDRMVVLGDLKNRNRFGLSLSTIAPLIRKQLVGLAGVRQFFMRRPVTLSGQVQDDVESFQISALHFRCSSEQSEQLKHFAKQHQVSLNELLACYVFEACDQWRSTQAIYSNRDWLRMMVPMNMRENQGPAMAACNIVSCIFLDRTGEQIADRPTLLQSIHDEMDLIKRNRLGFTFLFSLWIKKLFRIRSKARALQAPVPHRCQTSIVFSNMGRLMDTKQSLLPISTSGQAQAGDILLEACDVLAPVAPLMNVAITTYQYAGRITFALRYDPRALIQDRANELMQFIIQRIQCPRLEVAPR